MNRKDILTWITLGVASSILIALLALLYFPKQEYSGPIVGNTDWSPKCEEKGGDTITFDYGSTSTDVVIYDYSGKLKCRYTIE